MKSIYILLAPFLLMAKVNLEDIEVEASLGSEESSTHYIEKEGYMHNAPMQKQLTAEEALSIAGTNGDPLKALKSFAGVVSNNNDSGSDIYIHGSKSRETKFSLNQLPLGYVFHLGGIHSVVAPEAISQIDAYLGGFDTTYDAMGAVVDITPKYPTGGNSGRVHLGLYDADFAVDAKLGEDTSLFLSGRRSYFDLIATKIMDNLNEDEDDKSKKTTFTVFPQYYDAQMILTHNVGNSAFSLEAITSEDRMKLYDTMQKEKDPAAVGKLNLKYGFTTVGARWNYMGDDFESMTLLSNMKTKQDSQFYKDDFFVETSTDTTTLYHETVLDVEEHKPLIGFELKSIKAPLKAHTVNSVSQDDFAPLVSDQEVVDVDKTFKAKTYALFAQDIWDLTEKDHFRYGVRAWNIDFQKFGSGVDPRFAYVHDFDNDLSASLAIGRYSQLPELAYVIDSFGNPNIKATEFSNHYALSLSKKFDEKSSLVVEPYFKTFDNLAIADDRIRYESVGEGEAYGVDITYRKKIDNFDVIAAYTFVKAKRELNTNSNKMYTFEGDIPHTFQLNGSYTFSNNWKVATLFKYNSGKPYTPIEGTEEGNYNGEEYKRPVYGEYYSKRMPSNYDLDIQISKKFKYAKSSLELGIELMNVNTLFKKNVYEYKYNDDYERDGEYDNMSFLPAVHVTYRF